MRRLSVRFAWGLAAAVLLVGPVMAQEPVHRDSAQAEALRLLIQERFAARVRAELGLSDEQMVKLKAVGNGYAQKRRGLEAQQRQVRSALGLQLRPGVAADADSVTRLVDQITALRVSYVQTFQDEMRDLQKFLTPVQRGQFFLLQEKLLNRVRELRELREQQGGGVPLRPRPRRPQ